MFFSPRAVWFYRPLQALQFSVLYNSFGLNATAWGMVQVLMHLINVALAAALTNNITRRRGFALCAAMLFGCSWIYADVLTWKANINTLQWGFTTLAACVVYCGYIDCGCRAKYVLALVLAFANLFTKESAVMLPLLLLTCAWWKNLQTAGTLKPAREWWKSTILSLLPFALLSLGYVMFHRLSFVNIDPDVQPQYIFAAPPRAFVQWMHGISHSMFGWAYDPVFIGGIRPLQRTLVWLIEKSVILPIVLCTVFIYLRMRMALAALAFTAVALLPTVFLQNYYASRYFYLPALGGSLVWGAIAVAALDFYRAHPTQPRSKLLSGTAAIVLTIIFLANIIQLQRVLAREARAGSTLHAGFDVLRQSRTAIEPRPLIFIVSPPPDSFDRGRGMKYFARFALDDWEAEAHNPAETMGKARYDHLNTFTHRHTLDFRTHPPTLRH